MIRAEQFRLFNVQAVVYLANPEEFTQSSFLSAILPPYAARYNGDLQALALPSDAPPEFPSVILLSRPAKWQLRASPARVDSLWGLVNLDDEEDPDVIAQCAEVLERYVQESKVRIGRLALVLSRFSQVEDPTRELIDHFCNDRAKEEPLRRSQMFELHNHKVYIPAQIDKKVNSWVRCRSGQLVPPSASVITVEQDLNTLEAERASNLFSADDIRTFFENASKEANDILGVYFPEEVG
jgi:hypothetical protein